MLGMGALRPAQGTCVFDRSQETQLTAWWLGFSHLQIGKPRIPLVATPYVKEINQVSKGILARKDKKGRWRFEVVEKILTPGLPKINLILY